MNTLATAKFLYTHGLEGWIFAGILMTLLGLLIGWFLWRHCKAEAERVEAINNDLRNQVQRLEGDQNKLKQLISSLS